MPIGYQPNPESTLDRFYRAFAARWSRRPSGLDVVPPAEHLAGFLSAQRLAYDAVTSVAKELRPGITEAEAAQRLQAYLTARGCDRYLHRPFAWFGDHARFDGYGTYDDYHPGDRPLASDHTVILDVAPILDGFIGDVGYTTSLQSSADLERGKAFLLALREHIPTLFLSGMSPAEVWLEVNRQIIDAGFDNIHAKYPFCTLGHRVFRVKARKGSPLRVGRRHFGWFALDANLALLRAGPSVTINAENMGAKLGLWAIEPHIGWPGGGAKFEEILVVEPDRAWWLQKDVPHVIEATKKVGQRD